VGAGRSADYRDGGDKPSHDQIETATRFAPLILGCAQSIDSFRFAQMALADVGNLTHANNKDYRNSILGQEAKGADYRDGRDKPAMTK
jgi:hypothetical protein